MSSSAQMFSEMPTPDGKAANLEERLWQVSADFLYPVTPDIAGRERQRLELVGRRGSTHRLSRLVFALALMLIIVMALLLVSPVRARMVDFFRLGAVRIFFNVPTATATPAFSETPSPIGAAQTAATATPQASPTPLLSALDLAGETTLSHAQEQAGFSILLPGYPPDLATPDHVFLQQFGTPVVFLVWTRDGQPGQVRLTLSETSSEQAIFRKYDPRSVLDTQVNDQPAVWVDGDYIVEMANGDTNMMRLISHGHTLIWTSGEMTFRLETDEPLEEAIRIAESLP